MQGNYSNFVLSFIKLHYRLCVSSTFHEILNNRTLISQFSIKSISIVLKKILKSRKRFEFGPRFWKNSPLCTMTKQTMKFRNQFRKKIKITTLAVKIAFWNWKERESYSLHADFVRMDISTTLKTESRDEIFFLKWIVSLM